MLDSVSAAGAAMHMLAPQRHPQDAPAETRPNPPAPDGNDSVELSEQARRPAIREALVQRVRTQIAQGQYLSPEKLKVTVDRLHQELNGKDR